MRKVKTVTIVLAVRVLRRTLPIKINNRKTFPVSIVFIV